MNVDNIFVIGISYKEVENFEREKIILSSLEKTINSLKIKGKILGYVNLVTCLRIEFYVELADTKNLEEILKDFIYKEKFYVINGMEAIKYIFKVSCGYYSIIKGEDQILSQIKKAYLDSLNKKKVSKILNVIFNKAIEIGKKFRNVSKISQNALSLEALSLKIIRENIKNIESKKILILGTGDLAKSILYLLIKEDIKNLTITNRTKHKALEIKNMFDVNVIDFEYRNREIIKSDIVISATSAPYLILEIKNKLEYLSNIKKYLFLDLAVPRDIDPKIGELENVKLINIESVWERYKKNQNLRNLTMEKYKYLIDAQIEKVEKWYKFYNKGEKNVC